MAGHGVHRTVSCRYGFGLAVDGEGVAVNIDEGLAVGIERGVDILALGSLDHVGALVAATMQAVVKGCAGNGIERALVGLAARVKVARRRRRPCSLNSLCRPILCPGQSRIAVGVLAFNRLCVLLVVSCLQRVIDRGLDGVGRDGGSGDGINVCSVRLDDLVRHTSDVLAVIAVFGFVEIVPALASQRIVSLLGDLNGGDLARGDLYGHLDLVAVDVPLASACSGVIRVGHSRALILAIGDLAQIV